MEITKAESYVLQVPLNQPIADGMQAMNYFELVGINIHVDEGIRGIGYTLTVGAGGSVIQKVIDDLFIEALIGKDPYNVKEIWWDLYYGRAHWIGRAGAVTMAQAAVDIALWDIIAKKAERPLWQVLGGCRSTDLPAYITAAGWLNFTEEELIQRMKRALDSGYTDFKMKVGKPDPREDYHRVKAVREALGDEVTLMIDVNQAWDFNTACVWGQRLEEFNLVWLEEPLHPDDIKAHRLLREKVNIPIALGEHVYTTQAFRDYIEQEAVDILQVDVTRIGGITPWMEVAAMANVNNIRVCPHAGDLGQVHQHLIRAIPNSWFLEGGGWWTRMFKDQVEIKEGMNLTPLNPGASTEFDEEYFEKNRVS
ncbi:MAG: mandelate racemase/muconate lactonizing enzyme family protein [Deltaproteobacteria bacterium]|nr:mandelate racemase/muconate lactonizing enzyme family protein [Deltaproteobacteria bacterium]